MPITDAAVERLMAPLIAARPLTSRKMFGGLGIYCEGVFFAVIDDDRLFFKSDEISDPAYDAFGADQWVIGGEAPSIMPYRELPSAILADAEAIGSWIDSAVEVAQRKKTKTTKTKSAKSSKTSL